MAVGPEVSVNVVAVSEAGSIASLKVALMPAFSGTSVASVTGVMDRTVGPAARGPVAGVPAGGGEREQQQCCRPSGEVQARDRHSMLHS